jgi:hypothetical protein
MMREGELDASGPLGWLNVYRSLLVRLLSLWVPSGKCWLENVHDLVRKQWEIGTQARAPWEDWDWQRETKHVEARRENLRKKCGESEDV